jgi:hypothetical protein
MSPAALSWLSHVEGVPGGLVERSLLADVELVLGDPAEVPPLRWTGRPEKRGNFSTA